MPLPKIYPDAYSNERFWAKVDIQGPDDCWNWKGATSNGRAFHASSVKKSNAARFVLFGPYADSPLWALHTCDNPLCVNPNHLFAGTAQDNADDMMEKGRHLSQI